MTRSLFKLNLLDPPLVLFVLSAVAGVYPAYDRSSSWPVLAALIAGAFLYALISRISVSERCWHVVAVSIVALAVFLSLYFVTQYAHLGYDENLGPLSGLGALIGRIVPSLAVWSPHVNGVATFVEGVVFLAVGLTLTQKRWLWRLVGAASVGVMGLALLMAGSRGGWLAVAVAGLLWAGARWWPVRVIVAAGCIVGLGLTLYVVARGDIAVLGDVPVVGRLLSAVFLRPDRLDVYRGGVYLIQDFPLTGIGLGDQFAMVHSRYVLLIQYAFLTYSHNLYLEVWLEQGLLGIVALVWLIASLYQAAWTHKKARTDLLFQSTWIGLTAIFVHGITDARQYEDLWCWLPFFGLLGLGGGVLLRQDAGETRRRRCLLPVGVAAAFLILVAVALFPWSATYYANRGCVAQAQVDLSPVLDDGQRTILQKQAAEHYRRAIQIDPGNRTARQRLGLMLIEEARFGEGVEHLEVAWEADPGNTTTRKALGLAYVWVGELEEARPLLSDAPDIVEELNVWGWWRGTQQQMEQSLHAYRMSLLLEPDQPEVRELVEQLEAQLGQ
jgi:O-antigen ligase